MSPVAAASLHVHLRLRRAGVPVEAVCDHAYRKNGRWVCAYRYVDSAGESHYDFSQKPYPLPIREPGQPVSVVYDPRRPERSRTRYELRRPVPWAGVNIGTYLFVQLVLGILGGAYLAVGMFER
ncbi:hypothetical protein RND61_06440 [Streptomyces sp. TRM76323]|uniref:DUF3592 domain-containing protein n=1 Tax=Streptomyces tamarix TaxID=3078565 RepID=A0ABU3QH50_9ACTN|nr:hypothetical protein [Streptomyces tamarix]MDT9681712.1 hypothetical protein [Streptomyces tamarix]